MSFVQMVQIADTEADFCVGLNLRFDKWTEVRFCVNIIADLSPFVKMV
jgi:hypothetical protein